MKNVTALPCEMQNSFIDQSYLFPQKVNVSENNNLDFRQPRKDETSCWFFLLEVTTLSSPQCFDTAGWVTLVDQNMEKSQHTDFNKDKTNESASVACSKVNLI